MTTQNTIDTEFEDEETADTGVEKQIVATEDFDFHGEPVVRTTKLAILEDGGVHLSQKTDQGTFDSMTLGGDVAKRLLDALEVR